MAAWAEFDPRPILRRLTEQGVDFVVVGGIAAVLHGSPRVTQDLDVCFASDAANLVALGRVLTELHARPAGVDEEVPFVADERTLARIEVLTLQTDLGRLDVMTRPDGAPRYAALRADAVAYDIGGFVVRVCSIPDLIAMKRAADRDKDRADVTELEAIERLSRER
jgi:predicted nucleotidyltransferase